MATALTKRVVRETTIIVRGKPLMVCMNPNGVIEVWRKHTHERYEVPIEHVWLYGGRIAGEALHREKQQAKRMRKAGLVGK